MAIFPASFSKNSNDEMMLGGVSLLDLAQHYGTPLYVMDEETVRRNCRRYTRALQDYYPNSRVLYAGKANLNIGLLNLVANERLGLDVVSGGELFTALKSNMDPRTIYFHGNNKSVDELKLALQNNVTIVVDNELELSHLVSLSSESNPVPILIRLKPEIDAHTHAHIKTGQLDSKFGFDRQDLPRVLTFIKDHKELEFLGLHSHIGSQIFDVAPYEDLVEVMLDFVEMVHRDYGLVTQQLNLGGGIGISYLSGDDPPMIGDVLCVMAKAVKAGCERRRIPLPMLLVEPGRSIVGSAGVTLYSVGAIKNIPDLKTYIFVDGGMADNPRPIMYQAKYSFVLAKNPDADRTHVYAIAGKFCETGDVISHRVRLPEVSTGDVLVVLGTGAYNYAMASNYNRALKPAMVVVGNGEAKEWVRRETLDDLIRCDVYDA